MCLLIFFPLNDMQYNYFKIALERMKLAQLGGNKY